MKTVGFCPRGIEPCGRRRSGWVRPTGGFYSSRVKAHSVLFFPSARSGIAKRLRRQPEVIPIIEKSNLTKCLGNGV